MSQCKIFLTKQPLPQNQQKKKKKKGKRKKFKIKNIFFEKYLLFQKLKQLENCEFNHLTIILILTFTHGPKLIKGGSTHEIFNDLNER